MTTLHFSAPRRPALRALALALRRGEPWARGELAAGCVDVVAAVASHGGVDPAVAQAFSIGRVRCLVLDTQTATWHPGLVPGLQVMSLHTFETQHTALVRWAPDTHFHPHRHSGGEEILVLEGVFSDEHGDYPAGSWLRSPHMSQHQPFSREGCLILVKTGHLT